MNTLHFTISEIEPKYYADGEDAYAMRRELKTFEETKSDNSVEKQKSSKVTENAPVCNTKKEGEDSETTA